MSRGPSILVLALGLAVLGGCASGFAPAGDDDDDKFDQVELDESSDERGAAAVAPTRTPVPAAEPTSTPAPRPTATATPVPTPTATPTATPTPTPTPTATPTPTPTPTPMLPPEVVVGELRATIGEPVVETVVAVDPDGEIVDIEVLDDGLGLFVTGELGLRYIPTEAGTATARVRVTDSQGLSAVGQVRLVARFRGHPQALVAMGDSVASGHGLDYYDYLGDDPCWRSGASYPRRSFDRLVAAGVFPLGEAEFALLACSGYDVDDLWERTVTGGFSDISPADGLRSQLDWAVRSNPRFITLTIGANDTGFVGPARLFLADQHTLDRDQVDRRMAVIERDLRTVLGRLVDATDATVFVTNYYNPTAERPQGIATCRLECFATAAAEVVDRMNAVIEQVAAEFPADRVVFVDVASAFVGKGAPNGLGPDGLREAGFGDIGELVGADQLGDVHPYCARGEMVGESWINPVDCVHPDDRGTDELAALMTRSILGFVATNPLSN